MSRGPIVEEVRAIREEFAKEHGYNVQAIVRALQQEEREGGWRGCFSTTKEGIEKTGRAEGWVDGA